MIPVRRKVEISDGVWVDLLFTPRLALYEDKEAQPLDADAEFIRVMERYADIMYCAALNAWELDGHGTAGEFPHKRGDFHAWMQADPKGFTAAVKFAVCALTGRTERQLMEDEGKRRQNAAQTPAQAEDGGVKKKSCWLSRIMGRLRRSS